MNDAQRAKAKENVEHATTRTNIASQLQDYTNLNNAMKTLRDSVNNVNQIKTSSDYINEDSGPKEAYNQAINNAQTLINATGNPVMSADAVNEKAQAVTTAQNNLHGQQKLQDAQHNADTEIDNLTHLTTAQKASEKTLINNKQTRTEVRAQLEKAKTLDSSMGTLKSLVNSQIQVQTTSNYINEDQPQQTAFNNAITEGRTIINKTSDPILDNSTVVQAINKINTKKSDLHGEQKLETDKTSANNTLGKLADLNTPQKEAIKNVIDSSNTRTEISSELEKAKTLNNAMHTLRQNINDNANVPTESNYINAEPGKQQAYT